MNEGKGQKKIPVVAGIFKGKWIYVNQLPECVIYWQMYGGGCSGERTEKTGGGRGGGRGIGGGGGGGRGEG